MTHRAALDKARRPFPDGESPWSGATHGRFSLHRRGCRMEARAYGAFHPVQAHGPRWQGPGLRIQSAGAPRRAQGRLEQPSQPQVHLRPAAVVPARAMSRRPCAIHISFARFPHDDEHRSSPPDHPLRSRLPCLPAPAAGSDPALRSLLLPEGTAPALHHPGSQLGRTARPALSRRRDPSCRSPAPRLPLPQGLSASSRQPVSAHQRRRWCGWGPSSSSSTRDSSIRSSSKASGSGCCSSSSLGKAAERSNG